MTYKFSVVMPIFNLEAYLRESIGSLIRQTIGFEENIQLILVNDGSTDGTREICLEYQKRYPDNVVYVSQENKGVSAARKAGLLYASGQYINFFDGDDLWQEDGFEKVWDFMQQHEEDTDVVVCAQKLFEAKQGYRETYYKFKKGDRVIRIEEEPTSVELSIVSAFFRKEALDGITFDERLDYGECAKFLCQVLLGKGTYGVMQSVEYHVRKRADHSSASQNHKLTWQTSTLPYCQQYLCDLADEADPAYRPYLQHVVLKTLKYRITQPPMETGESTEPYKQQILSMVRRMEDEVILQAPYMGWAMKWYCLKQKHGETLTASLQVKGDRVFVQGKRLGNLAKRALLIREMKREGKNCVIRGWLRLIPELADRLPIKEAMAAGSLPEKKGKDNGLLVAMTGGRDCPMTVKMSEEAGTKSFWGEPIATGWEFEVCVPFTKEGAQVRFFLERQEGRLELQPAFSGELRNRKPENTFIEKSNKYLGSIDNYDYTKESGLVIISEAKEKRGILFMEKTKHNWLGKAVIVVLAVVAVLCYAFIPAVHNLIKTILDMFATGDFTVVKEFVASYGVYAAVVSFLLMILQSIAAPLPAFLITLANANLFGWWQGAILSWSSAMAGAAVCFFISRILGRDVVEKLNSKASLQQIDRFFEKHGKMSILIARLLPFISFDIVSYAAGLTSMSFGGFFLATGLGQLPATIVYSYVGGMLTGGAKLLVNGLLILFALSGLIILFRQLYMERQKKAK